ncbi:type II secretion system protein GspL [Parasphingopyxis lamellibrachiae]|uniref:Type II secretion system protein L (GspL) n=1 Tax=Parasphingopyxis lamellibrachiae TaxID=680125 RepID=A0A3D9FDD8_9SPHN|nr:type II secretion system protein GspL [Parasphingopyxis lamellibrachiae]RED15799.1 type II secretion system protein L (GspL) [Parasphingopyxis lamellibrachiae]
MSEERFLLLFLGEEPGWMRLAGGRCVARKPGFDTLAFDPDTDDPEMVILVVPGSDVALHWADIPAGLAPAQTMAAARIMADEVSAEPLEATHIAFGQADEEGHRWLAVTARAKMDSWLGAAAALGIDPDGIVPEPVLMAPPETGVHVFRRAGLCSVRGQTRAFAAEPEIAALLIGDEPSEALGAEDFEGEVGAMLADAPLNLRQGDYAKRRQWKLDNAYVRRVALLAATILLVTLLIQLTMIARYSFAADALEREAMERARDAIPGTVEIVNPETQLRAQLAGLGGGPGYGEQASAAFAAIRDTAGVELQAMIYDADNTLQLTAAAPGQAELQALQQRMIAAGLLVTPGAVRDAGGLQIGEFTVNAP